MISSEVAVKVVALNKKKEKKLSIIYKEKALLTHTIRHRSQRWRL